MAIPRHAGYNSADPYGSMRPSSGDKPKKVVKAKTLKQRAQARLDMGKGGAATYKRLGMKPPGSGKHPAKGPAKAPASSLSPSDQELIDAATRLRFGDQETGLNQQIAANQSYQQNIPAWYAQAKKEIADLQASGQQNQQVIQNDIRAYNSNPILDTGRDQAAAASRENLNKEFAAKFARDQNANSAFMDRLGAAQAIQQTATQGQAYRDRQNLLAALTLLQGQKGDFKTTYGAELESGRAKAANEDFKNNLAARALGLKVDTYENVQKPLAQSLAKDRVAGKKVARTNARTQRGSLKQRQKQDKVDNALRVNKLALDAYTKAHPELKDKSKSTFTPDKVRSNQKEFRKIRSLFDPKTIRANPGQVKQALIAPKSQKNPGGGQDPLMADAIVQSIAYGGVDQKTAKKFYKAYGFRLKVRHTGADMVNTGLNVLKVVAGK